MTDWLLHMTEEQRSYAAGLVDAMLEALGTLAHVPIARSTKWSRLTVHCLPDRRPGASVALSDDKVFLRTPLSPRRGRLAAEIVGSASAPVDVIADGDVAVMIVTLCQWRSALRTLVTAKMVADAEQMRTESMRLLRGVVHAHRPDWEMATFQSSDHGEHRLRIFNREADGRQSRRIFSSRPTARGDGGMTPELAAEFDRILGRRAHAHVVELERWSRYRLCFDAPPPYCISPACDPMTTLRALNAVPRNARLVNTDPQEPSVARR